MSESIESRETGKNPIGKRRLQFDFSEEAFQEINQLLRKTGLPNRAELIRHALKYLDWSLEKVENGGALYVEERRGSDKFRRIEMPFWNKEEQNVGTGR